jgi:spermidine/putrescine transport system ATP-binding protein
LKRLQIETGITFVFVTHDQEEALTMSDRIAVMSSGRILQIGTPRDIYTRPANRFVAGFIGETNFLAAEIRGDSAAISGGEVAVPAAGRTGAATLAVRPEHIRLQSDVTNGAIPATVSHAVYFGTDSHVHLSLADGTEVVARLQSDADSLAGPEPGTRLGLTFAPGAVQVLAD